MTERHTDDTIHGHEAQGAREVPGQLSPCLLQGCEGLLQGYSALHSLQMANPVASTSCEADDSTPLPRNLQTAKGASFNLFIGNLKSASVHTNHLLFYFFA